MADIGVFCSSSTAISVLAAGQGGAFSKTDGIAMLCSGLEGADALRLGSKFSVHPVGCPFPTSAPSVAGL
jgi:hypothetical protein